MGKEDRLQLPITFSMLCVDPFAYSTFYHNQSGTLPVPAHFRYPTIPEKIVFRPTATTSYVKLVNNRSKKMIHLKGSYAENDWIEINTGEVISITHENSQGTVTPILSNLQLTSDVETFDILAGDTFKVTPAGTHCNMEIRERTL